LAASVDRQHLDGARVEKAGASVKQRNAIAPELPAHKSVMSRYDGFQAAEQCCDLDVRFQAEVERCAGGFEPIELECALS